MHKSCLIPLLVLLVYVPLGTAQDMGPNWQGGRGGRRNMDDMQGGQMQGMRGMRGMGGGMGPMGGMGGGMGPMGGGMSPEVMQQMRMQRMQAMLQSIDTNRNGQIDPEEAQGPNGLMIENILRRAGVEPKYPISLSKVQEAMNNRSRGVTPANNPASSATPASSSEESKAAAASTTPPLVPTFDVAMAKQTPVPGFGVLVSNSANSAKKSGASSDSSSTSSASPTSAVQLDDKIRKYAESLLKQYDANKNGKLEKEEWSEMKEKYKAADKNRDGVITLDELTEFLVADSQSGPKQSSGVAIASTSSSSAGSNNVASLGKLGKIKHVSLRSPTERLPEGLPDWFARKDADGDGQISMFEYTGGDSTEAKAHEFARYDLNNDGVITPQECLKIDKKK